MNAIDPNLVKCINDKEKVSKSTVFWLYWNILVLQKMPVQDGRTTADIFEKLVHHYLIKNAIADGNVLGFNVDYVRTISSTVDIEDDEEVEAIDTEEVLMDDQRISNIVDYVLKIHNSKN